MQKLLKDMKMQNEKVWQVELSDKIIKQLSKLPHNTAMRILRFLEERIATTEDPRRMGKSLKHGKKGLWRYRVGDYRIFCKILSIILSALIS